jgi:transcriptional regulator with XRE-family HTH domain
MPPSKRAQIRKRAGLTQVRLAKLTGISQTRLSGWENHETELSAEKVERIARALHSHLTKALPLGEATELARTLETR